MLVLELVGCGDLPRRENIIALGNSDTGKAHVALALGLAACRQGFSVTFTTAASLVNPLLGARHERRLLKLQRELQAVKLPIADEPGYADRSRALVRDLLATLRARLDFRHLEPAFRGLDLGPGIGASHPRLLDRLTHRVSLLAMNGDSYRIKQSAGRRRILAAAEQNQVTVEHVDPDTREITES